MNIVIDVGGTTTRMASSKDGRTFLHKERFPSEKNFEKGITLLTASIKKILAGEQPSQIVIGIPGTIDHKTQLPLVIPHLPGWNKRDVIKALSQEFHCAISLAHDAELGALGEAYFGAGKGYRIVGYLAVGTGIGGALVIDCELLPSVYGREPGHMNFDLTGKPHPGSGQRGDWELYASGSTFQELYGADPKTCTDPKIWERFAQRFGQGVVNTILLWSPEIMIIGGGMANAGELLFTPLVRFVSKRLKVFPPPPIRQAMLGDDAGLYGGLALLK
ncbi:MAG: hypothetical protein A3A65_01230 [Candidatus Chisholmbacteria bacterium RIFCSPLOWO2_01_FULL_49_14]|uniref:ROK family protein n=1 Tax=Candidatus Chisholmbacteria bacterium RIFCSPLOWO2_01_FULL_49_14 TaxID=1797593 RepID=A0A1G1VZE1_9BACT|nr:MAG: hypothetical protein A3A65_01230 [Candidatus Chisholmbacteria bacterium RIFCSPLOWO2_01_FULL_49_14]